MSPCLTMKRELPGPTPRLHDYMIQQLTNTVDMFGNIFRNTFSAAITFDLILRLELVFMSRN